MVKSAKLLLIGALALLFSVAVLLENSTPVDTHSLLTAGGVPSELAPGVSSSSTDVVEPRSEGEPKAIIEAALTPIESDKKEKIVEGEDAVEDTSIDELLEKRSPPKPVIEEAPLLEEMVETPKHKKREEPPLPERREKEDTKRTYVVRKNDSFWKIAQKVWGRGSEWKRIWEANRDVCPRPDALYPGLVLTIPEKTEDNINISVASSRRPTNAENEPIPGRYYTVRKGDVLSIISQKAYGKALLWRKILDANRDVLPDEWSLRAGMRIFIPRLK